MENDKLILDACCGGRSFWFNKQHPKTLYIDIRREKKGFDKNRPNFEVQPDEIQDFRDLPYKDKSFKLIIRDPPFVITRADNKSWLTNKYGCLVKDDWRDTLKEGFEELWRVLDLSGVLILKFSNNSVKFEEVLKLFHTQPLFGTTTRKKKFVETRWFCFMKFDKKENGTFT